MSGFTLRSSRTSGGIRISQEASPFNKAIYCSIGVVFALLLRISARDLTQASRAYIDAFLWGDLLFNIMLPTAMIAMAFYFFTMRSVVEITTTQVTIYGRWTRTKIFKLTDLISVEAMRDAVFKCDSAFPGVRIRHADGAEVVFRYMHGFEARCRAANAIKCALDGDFRTQKERDDIENRTDGTTGTDGSDPRARLLQ